MESNQQVVTPLAELVNTLFELVPNTKMFQYKKCFIFQIILQEILLIIVIFVLCGLSIPNNM